MTNAGAASQLKDGDKFAVLALPRAQVEEARLEDDFWVTHALSLSVADHWRKWIGEVRIKELEDAGCFVVASQRSRTLSVLDAENQLLLTRVTEFLNALTMVQTPACSASPMLITGSRTDGELSVRQMATLQIPVKLRFSTAAIMQGIDQPTLRIAFSVAGALANVRCSTSYVRLKRAIPAFLSGIQDPRVEERLHQFCRCIDGVILSGRGSGRRDFAAHGALCWRRTRFRNARDL